MSDYVAAVRPSSVNTTYGHIGQIMGRDSKAASAPPEYRNKNPYNLEIMNRAGNYNKENAEYPGKGRSYTMPSRTMIIYHDNPSSSLMAAQNNHYESRSQEGILEGMIRLEIGQEMQNDGGSRNWVCLECRKRAEECRCLPKIRLN